MNAKSLARLEEILRSWKCPACGGSCQYTKYGRGPNKEKRRPHPQHEIVSCKKCDGTGLDPRAMEALTVYHDILVSVNDGFKRNISVLQSIR